MTPLARYVKGRRILGVWYHGGSSRKQECVVRSGGKEGERCEGVANSVDKYANCDARAKNKVKRVQVTVRDNTESKTQTYKKSSDERGGVGK
jgi:hypothetical protein